MDTSIWPTQYISYVSKPNVLLGLTKLMVARHVLQNPNYLLKREAPPRVNWTIQQKKVVYVESYILVRTWGKIWI